MLQGERVVLRPLTPEDVEPLWRDRLDPRTWSLTSGRPLQPQTLEQARADFTGPTDSLVQFAADADGELVGRALLFSIDPLVRSAEVGLSLLAAHRGRGLGRDVLRVLVEHAFRDRNLRRVHLKTLASNAAGLHLYRDLGFVEEGRLREAVWTDGGYEDMVLMAVLRPEWRR